MKVSEAFARKPKPKTHIVRISDKLPPLSELRKQYPSGQIVLRLIPSWSAFLQAAEHDRQHLGDLPPF